MNPELTNNGLQPPEPHSEDAYEKAESAREWVAANLKPADVFSFYELSEWARENNFVLIDNNKDY